MIIEMQYDNTRQGIEVDVEDAAKWMNISIEEDDVEEKIQEAVDEMFNRPEYNNWHKQDRHRVEIPSSDQNDKEKVVNEPEDVYELALNKEVFNKYDDEYAREQGYEFCCGLIRQSLKPNIANIVIAIMLDGYKAQEVAEMLGDTPNNISHKYNRAKDKLSKVLDKNVLLNIL